MEIFNGFVKLENVNLGLGLFDGVHIGHKELISQLVEVSKSEDKKSVVITFSSSPAEKFFSNVKYLTTFQEKEKLISDMGVDYLIKLDFNDELMNISAEDYIKTLYDYFHPSHIITGFNHTFGRGKSGNSETLKNLQKKYNYTYKEIPPVKCDEEVVSSTLIRNYVEKGDAEKADKLLGRPYNIKGEVIKGQEIGRTIGFPTANINYPDKKIEIPFGVYAAEVELKGEGNKLKGVLNYGIKPTVNNNKSKPVAEVHIIGFNRDIYGQEINISILKKIRSEKKYNSVNELKEQIKRDIELC